MEWLERMNNAVNHMEENLCGDIDFETVARMACCSVYHFQRMFSFIADMPLSEYIRRRRLTMAAFELQNSPVKVIDLAMKYGYDSPISFTRAFQKLHGVTPSEARSPGVTLKAYPRISFHISVRGDKEMNYKVEQKEAFKVFGVERVFNMADEAQKKAIPEFWTESIQNGTVDRLVQASGIPWNEESIGTCPVNAVMCYRDTGPQTMPYMLFAYTPEGGAPAGYESLEVPASTWAIFSTELHTQEETTAAIQNLWRRIYTEWIPASGYEFLPGAQFEICCFTEKNKGYSEIWIPVKK